ncbi:hypothetical protein UQW22_06325 [Isoptericola halotolerans]|uniref:hypothetical protein n=1 Tax=Isoptericola halotolerans TaxID=300560 RepID=UPI00389018A6
MTSTTTSTSTGRAPGRAAAAGLLAVTLTLGACSVPNDVEQYIADAQVQAETLDADLQQLADQTSELTSGLGEDVTHAVDSAQAATDEALIALDKAAESSDSAVVALADAQVALEAASAELNHVIEHADTTPEVATALTELQEQINALRGQTENAGE